MEDSSVKSTGDKGFDLRDTDNFGIMCAASVSASGVIIIDRKCNAFKRRIFIPSKRLYIICIYIFVQIKCNKSFPGIWNYIFHYHCRNCNQPFDRSDARMGIIKKRLQTCKTIDIHGILYNVIQWWSCSFLYHVHTGISYEELHSGIVNTDIVI